MADLQGVWGVACQQQQTVSRDRHLARSPTIVTLLHGRLLHGRSPKRRRVADGELHQPHRGTGLISKISILSLKIIVSLLDIMSNQNLTWPNG